MSDDKTNKCWKIIGSSGDGSCKQLTLFGHCHYCNGYLESDRNLLNRELPVGFKEHWSEIISKPKENEKTDTIAYSIFKIADEWFALKTKFFVETVEEKVIHAIPFRTDRIFLGLVNVNGELLMCLSANEIFDLYPSKTEEKNSAIKIMVIINHGSDRYVFKVDVFLGIYRIPAGDIMKSPVTITKSPSAYTNGIYIIDDKSVGLIDENNFFNSLKKKLVW